LSYDELSGIEYVPANYGPTVNTDYCVGIEEPIIIADEQPLEQSFVHSPVRWNAERMDELLASLKRSKPFGKTGFSKLDHLLGGGLFEGVHIIAAEPGTGKSSLCLQIADSLAQQGSYVIYVSLEMTAASLLNKSLCRLSSEVDFRQQPLQYREISALINSTIPSSRKDFLKSTLETYKANTAPRVAVIDYGITTDELATLYEQFPQKPVLIIDYALLLSSTEEAASDLQQQDQMLSKLTSLYKANEIPILLICSKNKNKANTRELTSIMGSVKFSFDASSVWFLDTDGDTDDSRSENAASEERKVTLHIRKNRFGSVGSVEMVFLPAESRFYER
jgi:replicative DNA helicase